MIIENMEIPFELSEKQLEQFRNYESLLLEWNQKINLTAITEHSMIFLKHFMDSLMCTKFMEFKGKERLIDVGTGAGFPGIPLKILYPELYLTLMDSLKKRCGFLETVSEALFLEKIDIVHGRAEEMGKNILYRENYDIVTARAVTRLNVLAEYCLPFLKKGGHMLAFKGPEVSDEISEAKKAIQILGGKLEKVYNYELPCINDERSLVVIKKIDKTPAKYPRKPGIPLKNAI